VILSDVSIREELAKGRIVIDPLDDKDVQPSSVDLRVDRYFRVFRNDTTPYIDPKQPQEDLTELVEVADGKAFILHPGEFVLGSTLEVVTIPDDLVARLEGKSSLGRLGLLIHSSLPGSEPVVVRHGDRVDVLPIETVVRKRIEGSVVGFDPETLEVTFFPITGWFEGPPDRIYEIRLASGRSVRVTAGHNLFTLDRDGRIEKVRTAALKPGTLVAIPRRLPDPALEPPQLDLLELVPEGDMEWLVIEGPTIRQVLEQPESVDLLRDFGFAGGSIAFYRRTGAMPLPVARQVPGLIGRLGPDDRLRPRGGRYGLPVLLPVETELAWLLGFYVAEGYRRRGQAVFSNTDSAVLDRVERVLRALELPVYRRERESVSCTSRLLAALLGWLGTGGGAHTKRLPSGILGWPDEHLHSLLEGMMDGDGSRGDVRDSYWSSSPGLVEDVLLLGTRLGLRAAAYHRLRQGRSLFQVAFPAREHKLLAPVPLPDRLLVDIRKELGLTQAQAAVVAGFKWPTDLNNIERRSKRDAVHRKTLGRLRDAYRGVGSTPSSGRLDALVDGGVAWDRVEEVIDMGVAETIFDLEVRPAGRHVENFVAGSGGVFVSNTAGFVDAGFSGHLTLELSNVANLPIAIYPGMKIGQISFMQMTSPAENPYGSTETGSKYQGQRGPTPSRSYLNFESEQPPPE
jgi:dCTP deaminase